MPKVRASSATTGTMRGPSAASLSRLPSMRTTAMVVDISLPSAASAKLAHWPDGGTVSAVVAACRRRGR
ncbi:hypothetical protein D3C81_1736950 [compost metagenome]